MLLTLEEPNGVCRENTFTNSRAKAMHRNKTLTVRLLITGIVVLYRLDTAPYRMLQKEEYFFQ